MKARMFNRFSLLIGLCLLLALLGTLAATAQEPERPTGPDVVSFQHGDGPSFFSHPVAPGDLGTRDVTTPAVDLGEPGFSFRYVRALGEYGVAYFEDTTHINYPWGVAADGTNIWIAEGDGLRLLKYTNTGAFQMQIGRAGFRYGVEGTNIEWLADVAVDSSGNVWAADMGASHVIKFDASGNHVSELGQMWNPGSDNSRFHQPGGIAFDSAGNIYVSDGAGNVWTGSSGNHRIQIFDSTGNYLNTIGVTGVPGSDNSHFDGPCHIAMDDSDRLYVADTHNHRIQIFDVTDPMSPSYVATIGVSGEAGSDNDHLSSPAGVTTDAGYIYVADTWNHRVQVFNRNTRAYVATIGTGWGTGNTQFRSPGDVVVDSAGNIYVADAENCRVQQFSSSRGYVRTYGTTGVPYLTDAYHYFVPEGVAVASDGSIYLAEMKGRRLIKLNAAGVAQWTIGEPNVWADDNEHFANPRDVALDGTGRVYVADAWEGRVQIFDSDGTYYATLGTGQGSGDYEFQDADGVAVDSSGRIYVADRPNHRVQVYNSSRTYIATLGETGVSGADNAHFNQPHDVAVDSADNIYVVDHGNHRVQVFDSNRVYVRTIGITGNCGYDFERFCNPTAVTVDAKGRTYVADNWGTRVQVFDNTGAYLTTIGNSRGSRTGDLEQSFGLAVDNAGNLYVAEYLGHRLKEFAPHVPGWRQTNINGFGDRDNWNVSALTSFDGHLYAGTYNWSSNGAQLWRTGSPWIAVTTDGFGITSNEGINHLIEFQSDLYAGTANWDYTIDDTHGGQIWRSDDGLGWTRVISRGFGDPTNGQIVRFAVFSDTLYASTASYTTTHGTEIWRSTSGDTGDWTRVVANGFGDASNWSAVSLEAFNGHLYAGTENDNTGAEAWRTDDGTTWLQVNADGFGDPANWSITLEAFDDYLYAGTYNYWDSDNPGAELWRCQQCDGSDWYQIPIAKGFGDTENRAIRSLAVFDGALYALTYNFTTGMQVWRSIDGAYWEQVGPDGLGDSNNYSPHLDNSVAVFDDHLFVGTRNSANGGEVWMMLYQVYLPTVLKNY
jgi:streptogramin lyase